MKTDRQIKKEATQKEMRRVFDNMNIPPEDIFAECSDGLWVRAAWSNFRHFGWDKWAKYNK